MVLWPVLIVMTGLVVIVIAWPLFRQSSANAALDPADAGQLNVYKDQLAEIDRELARGVIGNAEADAARIELSRRMLALASRITVEPIGSVARKRQARSNLNTLKGCVVAAIPLIAIGLYLAYGEPGLPGASNEAKQTAQSRTTVPSAPDVGALIAQVEARLREAPDDGRGWDVIAPVYLRDQRFAEARTAFARAIELLGETSKRLLGLAESSIRASNGRVTDEARAAFEKVLKLEPSRIEPRLWLAVGREQKGELKEAADEYRALLAQAPADAPWRATVIERLAALSTDRASTTSGPPARGPTAEDASAAAAMPPEQRQQMIAGMVDSLHARLKANGRDPAGWQRLLRAYAVLGDVPKAKAALSEARTALAEDQTALSSINALAIEIGLGS